MSVSWRDVQFESRELCFDLSSICCSARKKTIPSSLIDFLESALYSHIENDEILHVCGSGDSGGLFVTPFL